MRRIMTITLLFILSGVCLADYSFTRNYSQAFHIDTILAADGNYYSQFVPNENADQNIVSMFAPDIIGYPELLEQYIGISLPYGKEGSILSVTPSFGPLYSLGYPVIPIQEPAKSMIEVEDSPWPDSMINPPFVPPNPEIYGQPGFWPPEITVSLGTCFNEYIGAGKCDLKINPIRYYPLTNQYQVLEWVTIDVASQTKQGTPPGFQANILEDDLLFDASLIESSVINPEDVRQNLPSMQIFSTQYNPQPTQSETGVIPRLVIITDDYFDGCQPLADYVFWKNKSGCPTAVVNLDSIAQYPGRDLLEQIRNFCVTARQNGTRACLIIGSHMHVPWRWCIDFNVPVNLPRYRMSPSDKYFWCHGDDWDSDQDNVFGEGQGDYLPDMIGGRIPVNNIAELTAWVNKALAHDKSRPSYYRQNISAVYADEYELWNSDYQYEILSQHFRVTFMPEIPSGDDLWPTAYTENSVRAAMGSAYWNLFECKGYHNVFAPMSAGLDGPIHPYALFTFDHLTSAPYAGPHFNIYGNAYAGATDIDEIPWIPEWDCFAEIDIGCANGATGLMAHSSQFYARDHIEILNSTVHYFADFGEFPQLDFPMIAYGPYAFGLIPYFYRWRAFYGWTAFFDPTMQLHDNDHCQWLSIRASDMPDTINGGQQDLTIKVIETDRHWIRLSAGAKVCIWKYTNNVPEVYRVGETNQQGLVIFEDIGPRQPGVMWVAATKPNFGPIEDSIIVRRGITPGIVDHSYRKPNQTMNVLPLLIWNPLQNPAGNAVADLFSDAGYLDLVRVTDITPYLPVLSQYTPCVVDGMWDHGQQTISQAQWENVAEALIANLNNDGKLIYFGGFCTNWALTDRLSFCTISTWVTQATKILGGYGAFAGLEIGYDEAPHISSPAVYCRSYPPVPDQWYGQILPTDAGWDEPPSELCMKGAGWHDNETGEATAVLYIDPTRLNDNYQPKTNLAHAIMNFMYNPVATDETPELPAEFSVMQNYPNPFNASTTIKFSLPSTADTRLDIYDILGRKVATLLDGPVAAGYHQVNWNADDYASGIYFYRVQAGEVIETRQMILMK